MKITFKCLQMQVKVWASQETDTGWRFEGRMLIRECPWGQYLGGSEGSRTEQRKRDLHQSHRGCC